MQNRKVLDTIRIADLVNEVLSPMVRWGAPFTIERITERRIRVDFHDGANSVLISVKELKPGSRQR